MILCLHRTDTILTNWYYFDIFHLHLLLSCLTLFLSLSFSLYNLISSLSLSYLSISITLSIDFSERERKKEKENTKEREERREKGFSYSFLLMWKHSLFWWVFSGVLGIGWYWLIHPEICPISFHLPLLKKFICISRYALQRVEMAILKNCPKNIKNIWLKCFHIK